MENLDVEVIDSAMVVMESSKCDCGIGNIILQALKELREYKILGVSPEQIKEIDKLYTLKCEELAKVEKRHI